ncbi:protein arginine N-methyltransferase 7 [Hydra vulgaris]|uniref:protein arginine N-methyltransferase 7 n=1 Tax=Hydra vulgaris TaxID=6087 RepID=UPI0032EA0968
MSKIFVQRLNAVEAKTEWVLEDDYDLQEEIARSTYAGMLHDVERNKKYFKALHKTIGNLKKTTGSLIRVLDIGTGTGILSMMATSAGADHVTACEVFEPMSRAAEKIIKKNLFQDKINIINKSSTNLIIPLDMTEKVNVLVTEIFDTELIGEGVLPTLRDAHERLLVKNCKVIPSSASVIVQLIESYKLSCMNKLDQNKIKFFKVPEAFKECPGTASAHEVQINQLYPNHLKLLSEAQEMKKFDFQTPYHHDFINKESKYSKSESIINITQSGTIDAVLTWWDLYLDESSKIKLSMEPIWMRKELYHWRDHWMQAVYYLPKALKVNKGDKLFVSMYHDDYSVWFDVQINKNLLFVDRPLCFCGLHVSWSRERFAMNNSDDMSNYFSSLIDYLKKKKELHLTVVGDTSFLPLRLNSENIFEIKYVEYSELTRQSIKQIIGTSNIKFITKKKLKNVLEASCIVAEPYFSTSLLPWHHLQIWHIKNCFLNVQTNAVLPQKAVLKVCLVMLEDLWKVRSPVISVESFDLTIFDELISNALQPKLIDGYGYFSFAEPFSMWEFKNIIVSDIVTLYEFNFQYDTPKELFHIKHEVFLKKSSCVHAAVIWLDFETENMQWSTGLNQSSEWVNYSKQGVYFFKSPFSAEEGTKFMCSAVLIPKDCEIMFNFYRNI